MDKEFEDDDIYDDKEILDSMAESDEETLGDLLDEIIPPDEVDRAFDDNDGCDDDLSEFQPPLDE